MRRIQWLVLWPGKHAAPRPVRSHGANGAPAIVPGLSMAVHAPNPGHAGGPSPSGRGIGRSLCRVGHVPVQPCFPYTPRAQPGAAQADFPFMRPYHTGPAMHYGYPGVYGSAAACLSAHVRSERRGCHRAIRPAERHGHAADDASLHFHRGAGGGGLPSHFRPGNPSPGAAAYHAPAAAVGRGSRYTLLRGADPRRGFHRQYHLPPARPCPTGASDVTPGGPSWPCAR